MVGLMNDWENTVSIAKKREKNHIPGSFLYVLKKKKKNILGKKTQFMEGNPLAGASMLQESPCRPSNSRHIAIMWINFRFFIKRGWTGWPDTGSIPSCSASRSRMESWKERGRRALTERLEIG